MSIDYIRQYYGVPAKRGARVEYTGASDGPRLGTIKAARGSHLMILLDGSKHAMPFHPTWELRYLDASSPLTHPNDPQTRAENANNA
ncbi:hypothetical protein [Bradyrhizobium sp. RDM4]|uniref:hypothetical protein n=1 Tax=Bradyrhizobium sp. RDM4 TaxID=3378765 RepID=UPI0038FBF585